DHRDTPPSPPVIIVDERLAQHFWPNQDPIGRRMYSPTNVNDLYAITPNTRFYTVVGGVRKVQRTSRRPRDEAVGIYYFPFTQRAERSLVLTVRADRNVESL